jgi:ankyrin repeat protein
MIYGKILIILVYASVLLQSALSIPPEQQKTSMQFLWNSVAFDALKLKSSETREKLKYALEQGANQNACDFYGTCLLSKAVMSTQQDAARLLLEHGASVNFVDKNSLQNTPLHWAAIQADPALVQLLLKYKADPLLCNRDGRIPPDMARALKDKTVFNVLVPSVPLVPIDTKLFDESNFPTAKTIIRTNQNSSVLTLLAKFFANKIVALGKPQVSFQEIVALLFAQACADGRADIIGPCLKNPSCGYLANIKSYFGDTPLHFAARRGHLDVVKQLCNSGACLIANSVGETASQCARANGHGEIADYIERYDFQNYRRTEMYQYLPAEINNRSGTNR